MSERADETAQVPLEWQIASGSTTAHVYDVSKPEPRRGEPGFRISGARARCGRYPLRNNDGVWFSYPVGPEADGALHRYMAQQCADCLDLANRPGQPGATP